MAASLQAMLKCLNTRCGISIDAALPEEPIDAQPTRTLRRLEQKQCETAPAIAPKRSFGREEFCAHGVEMHVIAHRPQIATFPADEQGLVAPGKNVTAKFVATIEARGVSAEEPLHPSDQVWLGCLDHEMKMIRRQAKRMHLPGCLRAGIGKNLEEGLPVHVVAENVVSAVPATHDVIDRSGE